MLPGGGAGIESVEWAALLLADAGYVVVITKPQLGGSTASYSTAVRAGIDFLLSQANPFAAETDGLRVGGAGWSLGARSLVRAQEEDSRIDAIVCWDNLAVSESGDAGSPSCQNTSGTVRVARAPALGQASDSCNNGIDSKKTGFTHWRASGVACVQLVFAGTDHFLWSASATPAQHALAHQGTLAWFDRWLKNDLTATNRLLSCVTPSGTAGSILSTRFRSAAFIDGIDTPDLRADCLAPPACAGDLDGNGAVNTADLTAFLARFGAPAGPGDPADLNADGAVNTSDLIVFLAAFGSACG
jgi:hypothetical protein